MNLQELRYLVALADRLHFGRAAEACHVSQPTLSTQIKKLEAYLGVALFERTNKAVHVTAVGEEVVARARRALAEADAILDLTRRRTEPLAGSLHVGIIPTLGPYLLPWLLPPLKAAYPKLQLVLQEGLTAQLLEQLAMHRIDAAILALPVPAEGIETLALFDEPFWFACPKSHRLAKAGAVEEAELKSERILLLTEGHCLRDQALAICGSAAAEPPPNADFRATSLETIRQMVAAGMGCTLLPAMAVDAGSNARTEIRPLAHAASRRIALIWRESYAKAGDLKLLAEVVHKNLPASVRTVAARAA